LKWFERLPYSNEIGMGKVGMGRLAYWEEGFVIRNDIASSWLNWYMKIGNIKRWARFNLNYLGNPRWDTGITPPELYEFLRTHQPGRALDLGCGTGTNLLTLAQSGWRVTGVEFALIAWRRARRKLHGQAGLESIHLGSVAEIDYLKPHFDLILDIGCFHNLPQDEKAKYRRQVGRLLAPQGTYLLYGFESTPERPRGLTDENLTDFEIFLELKNRQDGTDHGQRPSVWLEYVKKGEFAA
jgi:SAM-dependent methyltransferase